VTLDFWGTLVVDGPGADERYRAPRLRAWRRVLADAGIDVSAAALDAAYDRSMSALQSVWQHHRDVAVDYHVEAILAALDPAIGPALDSSVRTALLEAYAAPFAVVPPALDGALHDVLKSLRARGYALGIVSNVLRTPGRMLRDLLARRGLLDFFGVTTFSDEAGWRKPAGAIFTMTLERLAVYPAAAVHVGDDELLDVVGGRQAGLGTVLVCESPRSTAVRADVTIAGLAELPAALEQLERVRAG
jgi:HAD superfamily hydrolase (TIGR01549 family)